MSLVAVENRVSLPAYDQLTKVGTCGTLPLLSTSEQLTVLLV